MQLSGREFNTAIIARIKKTVSGDRSLSRRALSLRVCEWLQWRAPNGRLKEVSCRKALLELHRRRLVVLPVAKKSCFKASRPQPSIAREIVVPKLRCTPKELGEISI